MKKQIAIRLEEEDIMKLKIYAIHNQTTLQALAEESLLKLIKEERKMEKTYKEWRETLQELLDEGNPGSSDCGEAQVRKDFSDYAGLDHEITFEEMLELEENYEKEQRNMLKIIYTDTTDNNKRYTVAEVVTNHSMTIDQALELAGVNMDEWARQQGWDGYDYESLTME